MKAFLLLLCLTMSAVGQTFSRTAAFQGAARRIPPAAGGGSPALVAFTFGAENASTLTLQKTLTVTTGNLLVIGASWFNTDKTVTVTDTLSNVYTAVPDTKTNSASGLSTQLFYAKNITGGSDTITVTWSVGAGDYCTFGIWEFSGCSASSPLDGGRAGTATDPPDPITADFTTTSANAALVAITWNITISSVTPQASWTENYEAGPNVSNTEFQHRIVSSTGAYHGAAGLTGSGTEWVISFAAFK